MGIAIANKSIELLSVAGKKVFGAAYAGKKILPKPQPQKGFFGVRRETTSQEIAGHSVRGGNGLFVAVATGGEAGTVIRIMTSPDGINWTLRSTPFMAGYNDVFFANGLFVVTGAGDGYTFGIYTSPNGINWTQVFNEYLHRGCYGNGMFLLLSEARAVKSEDGVNWIIRNQTINTSPQNTAFSDVCYGNGLFVQVRVALNTFSSSRVVYTSPDGFSDNWTARTIPLPCSLSRVYYCEPLQMFIATGGDSQGGLIITSPDGINWTLRYRTGSMGRPTDICCGNGLLVVVATGYEAGGIYSFTSPDGINGKNEPLPDGGYLSVCYSPEVGRFVTVSFREVDLQPEQKKYRVATADGPLQ